MINHLTGEPMAETRNVLIEAARIARGDIHPLIQADPTELDALIVPGGFGAAKISVPLLRRGGVSGRSSFKGAVAGHACGWKTAGLYLHRAGNAAQILISRCV